jgi:Leucine-rich repeat (LRR) protein
LRTLNVSGNRLSALPFQLAALDSLTSLDLSYNEITALPEAFTLLENLKSLDLGGNQVCAVSPSLMAWAEARQPGWYATQLCVDSSQGSSVRMSRRMAIFPNRIGVQTRTDFGLPGRVETFDVRGRANLRRSPVGRMPR